MGEEFFAKGSNVQLGPGVCLARVPVNGRNFEYLSGEDPFLGIKSHMAKTVHDIKQVSCLLSVCARHATLSGQILRVFDNCSDD